MTLEQQLAEGLIVAANANMALTTPSDAVMRQAMENLAHPIAEAIKNGTATLTESSVSRLNAGADDDRLYITSDAGALVNGDRSTTAVTAGSVVFRRGGKWYVLGVGGGGGGGGDPEIDCYTKAETDALIAGHNTSPNAHADIREALNAEAQERDDADNREIRARQNADRQIREGISTTVDEAISLHDVSEDAHEDIRQIIADEVDERTDADTALQQQIDAITSKSDVVAIVGTYADLLALDTSTMFDNDIVKVLADESRQGKRTYYYWDLANEAWTYIGSEAETYTKSEVNTLLGNKADKVSNATSGNLAGLDGDGNLTDSGISPSDIANKVFIAIEYTTPFADILAAYNAGKVILLASQDGSRYYYLMNYLAPYGTALARFTFYYKDLDFHDSFDRRRDTYTYVESNNEWHNVTLESAKKSHASTDASFGAGSETNFGHVQLTGSVTQNSSKAVKSGAVYDALQDIRGDMASKQDVLASNSLAFIYKPTNGDATKFLNEQGNFVHVDEIPIQKIVVGQTLRRGVNCLYSYGSNNVLYVMTSWIERRQSGAAYEMILRPINTENLSYLKVLITEQYSVYTVNGIDGYQYNKWNLENSIDTDVVLVTYKEGVIAPSFNALLNAVHNRRDVLLAVYLENEAQEYYRLKWWKLYNSDNIYSFVFSTYIDSNHTFKSYVFDYNTGGVLQNVFLEVFSPISSVGTSNINDGAVTNAKLANYAVTSGKLQQLAVTNEKIADGAVGETKLANNAVTNDKIADSSVVPRHLSGIDLKYFITEATEGSYVEDGEYFATTTSARGLKYTAKNARAYMNARAYARLTFTAKSTFNTTSSGRVFNGVGHVESFSISSASNGYIHGLFGHHANLVILDLRKSGSWTDTLDLYFNIDQISSGVPYTLMVYNRTGNAVQITFRVSASTALTNSYVNGTTGTGNRKYIIDANSLENILIERDGNDLYLNAIWHGF